MPKRKRGAGEGTIFRRQNGRWVAEITLPGGKRRTMYAKTRREAAERLADAQAQLRAMLPITSADDITVAEYLRRWLVERCEPRLAPRTVLSYRGHVERQIIPSLGDIRLSALGPGDVTRMMDRWLATGLDNDTVARLRLILSSALGAAMQAELLTRNVAKLAVAPRATPRRVKALSADQVVAIAEAVRGTSAEGFATLALYAGLRRGEVLGLSWTDVDLAWKRRWGFANEAKALLLRPLRLFQRPAPGRNPAPYSDQYSSPDARAKGGGGCPPKSSRPPRPHRVRNQGTGIKRCHPRVRAWG